MKNHFSTVLCHVNISFHYSQGKNGVICTNLQQWDEREEIALSFFMILKISQFFLKLTIIATFPLWLYLCHFDVVSFYTKFPLKETIDCAEGTLKKCDTSRETVELLNMFKLCIENNIYQFCNNIHKFDDGLQWDHPQLTLWLTKLLH